METAISKTNTDIVIASFFFIINTSYVLSTVGVAGVASAATAGEKAISSANAVKTEISFLNILFSPFVVRRWLMGVAVYLSLSGTPPLLEIWFFLFVEILYKKTIALSGKFIILDKFSITSAFTETNGMNLSNWTLP